MGILTFVQNQYYLQNKLFGNLKRQSNSVNLKPKWLYFILRKDKTKFTEDVSDCSIALRNQTDDALKVIR